MVDSIQAFVEAVKAELTCRPELLREPYRSRVATGAHPLTGHCYVGSEALWHLLGGLQSSWRPMGARVDGSSHWWLRNTEDDRVIDVTSEQFSGSVPYGEGRGRGFLTSRPSKRAQVIIDAVMGRTDHVPRR